MIVASDVDVSSPVEIDRVYIPILNARTPHTSYPLMQVGLTLGARICISLCIEMSTLPSRTLAIGLSFGASAYTGIVILYLDWKRHQFPFLGA